MSNILGWICAVLALISVLLFADREHIDAQLIRSNSQVSALSEALDNQNAAIKKLHDADEQHQKNLNAVLVKSAALAKTNNEIANKILNKKISPNCDAAMFWGIQAGVKLSKWAS